MATFKMLSAGEAPFPYKCCYCGCPFDNDVHLAIPVGHAQDEQGVPSLCRACFIAAMEEIQLGYTPEMVAKYIVEISSLRARLDVVSDTLERIRSDSDSSLALCDYPDWAVPSISWDSIADESGPKQNEPTGDESIVGKGSIELSDDFSAVLDLSK